MDLNLQLKRKQDGFSWGPALAFMKKTLYVESNLAIKDQSLTSPLFGFFFQKEIDLITLNTEIKMGAILNFNADIQYRFKSNIEVGAFIDSTSITKDDNKHSFLRYGLNLNYVFDFLEIAN